MITSKVHSEEQRMNSFAQNRFVKAVQMRSVDELLLILADDGEFLGKVKNEFINDLITMLSTQLRLRFIHQVNYGFCLDEFPGAEVIEFRYATFEYLNSNELMETRFGSKPYPKEDVFHLALRFDFGKIVKIISPKKMCPAEELKIYGLDVSAN